MDDEEQVKTSHAAEIITALATVVYYVYLMRPASDVVPFRNKLYHYGSKAAESVAAWSWDVALRLRRAYRAEVDK